MYIDDKYWRQFTLHIFISLFVQRQILKIDRETLCTIQCNNEAIYTSYIHFIFSTMTMSQTLKTDGETVHGWQRKPFSVGPQSHSCSACTAGNQTSCLCSFLSVTGPKAASCALLGTRHTVCALQVFVRLPHCREADRLSVFFPVWPYSYRGTGTDDMFVMICILLWL